MMKNQVLELAVFLVFEYPVFIPVSISCMWMCKMQYKDTIFNYISHQNSDFLSVVFLPENSSYCELLSIWHSRGVLLLLRPGDYDVLPGDALLPMSHI